MSTSDVNDSFLYRQLLPLFGVARVPSRLQQALLKDPILIRHNADEEDIVNDLKVCAAELGVAFRSLDARLLHRYPQKSAYPWLESSGDNLTAVNITSTIEQSPLILYISSFDMIFHDPAQQHSTSPEDGLQYTFLAAFQAFQRELNEQIDKKRRSAEVKTDVNSDRSNGATGRKSVTVNQNAIAVVISTWYYEKMIAQWKAVFTMQVDMPRKVRREALFANGSMGKEKLLDALEEQVVWEYIEKNELGRVQAHALVAEYKKERIVHGGFERWHASLQRGRMTDGSVFPIFRSANSSALTTAVDADVAKAAAVCLARAVKQIPSLRGFDTVNGMEESGKERKQGHIAEVRWSDIGGLDRVRREILDVLELPFKYPALFHAGCPRRQGVLLYGPPGTGKTLVARAVATECGMNFISVKGPELLDMYVGESEKNVREVFQRAHAAAPCVLFFDEIDSLAPARAKGNNSGGGIMDRMVSQLLTEIDQVVSSNASAAAAATVTSEEALGQGIRSSKSEDLSSISDNGIECDAGTTKVVGKFVFIIAATNRPDLLDPALMRPGRFDRKIYLGVCKDISARLQILTAQTRKFVLHADVDLRATAEALPGNITGADIGAVSTMAYGYALERKLAELTARARQHSSDNTVQQEGADFGPDYAVQSYINSLPAEALCVAVTQEDLLRAATSVQPSVIDLEYYESLGEAYNDVA